MEHNDYVAWKNEGSWVQLKTDFRGELKAYIQASEEWLIAKVESIRVDVKHWGRTDVMFDIGPSDTDIDPSIPVPVDTTTADAPPYDFDAFPWFFFLFLACIA